MNKFLGGVSLYAMILRNAEGGAGGAGGGAGDGAAAGAPADGAGSEGAAAGAGATPESILFPGEGKPAGEGGEPKTDAGAAEWKEYEPDPAKSDEENAAAKAEHDKTKPADDKNKDDIANKVPEDGKYTLTMPDGVELDAELADALGPEFKELGLTNGQAQKLVDKYIATQQGKIGKQAEAWSKTVEKWGKDAQADREMGGANWSTTKTNALRAIDKFGTPALREYLQASGGGNHPEVIRAFAKAGALIREDNPAAGGAGGSGQPVDPAHRMFPNDVPKGK